MFDMQQMGIRISNLRKAAQLTQTELADRLGISFQAVSNWERGLSMPDISKLAELASLFASGELGVPVDPDSKGEHYEQHVKYLANWSKAIREDPDALFRAAGAAGRAATYTVDRWEEATGKQAPGRAEARAAYETDRAEKERLGDKKTAVEKQMAGARSERAERLKRSAEKKRQQQASTGPSRRGADPRDAGRSRGRSR
mgnify:CR=1 FL=1